MYGSCSWVIDAILGLENRENKKRERKKLKERMKKTEKEYIKRERKGNASVE